MTIFEISELQFNIRVSSYNFTKIREVYFLKRFAIFYQSLSMKNRSEIFKRILFRKGGEQNES